MSVAGESELKAPCLCCGKAEIEYAPSTCGCPAYCKGCAMKVATGGKCKVCSKMFGDVRRLDHGINCAICHQQPITYAPVSCGCPAYCKGCAMKIATGGHCKLCGRLFGELKQIQLDKQ